MPKTSFTNSALPLLGGYKVSSGTSIGQIGYMDKGTLNYIQTPDGISTRAHTWRVSVFGHLGVGYQGFLDKVNFQAQIDEIPLCQPGQEQYLQVVDIYPYKPDMDKAETFPCFANGAQRHLVTFKLGYRRYDTGVPVSLLVFFDLDFTKLRPFADNNEPGPVLSRLPDTDVAVGYSSQYPLVDVGYFRRFFIVTFPNVYNLMPLLIWWHTGGNGAWSILPWRDSAEVETVLGPAERPTVCVPMTVTGGPAMFLVWGCSENGNLRVSKALTRDVIGNALRVQQLLSTLPANNLVIPLYGGAADVPNRGMISFNSGLFVFGLNVCYIINQLVTISQENVLELAPQYNLAPFRGGCLSQRSLAKSWNEIYVGNYQGAVYTINRVMESGSYSTADLFLSTGVLNKDPTFTFKDTAWLENPDGLGVTTFYPLKDLHLFFDPTNNVVMCHFFWNEQLVDDHLAVITTKKAALLAYRNDCVKESTGWSNLDPPQDHNFIAHSGCIAASGLQQLFPSRMTITLWPAPPAQPAAREGFSVDGKLWYRHTLYTPFFKATPADILFMYQSIHFEIDRLGPGEIFLDIY